MLWEYIISAESACDDALTPNSGILGIESFLVFVCFHIYFSIVME